MVKNNIEIHDIYGGLSGLHLEFDEYELGRGIVLRKTYAHLMSHYLLAFSPAPEGKAHPAPWKPVLGGSGVDIEAELFISENSKPDGINVINLSRLIVALLRLWASPSIKMPVISNMPFSKAPKASDKEVYFIPMEVNKRHFKLEAPEGINITKDRIEWVKQKWELVLQLIGNHSEFKLALDALDSGQFQRSLSLAMVSIWGALEMLFSHQIMELRFRVSVLIAAYFMDAGIKRFELFKIVNRLYKARSKAAHGHTTVKSDDLLESFELLRQIIIKIIDEGKIPSEQDLMQRLFLIE